MEVHNLKLPHIFYIKFRCLFGAIYRLKSKKPISSHKELTELSKTLYIEAEDSPPRRTRSCKDWQPKQRTNLRQKLFRHRARRTH